jgi:plastocyanin
MQSAKNRANGIVTITFIVAVAASLTYYQFVFVPEASRKPFVRPEISNPAQTTKITIVKNAVLESNPKNFDPKDVRGIIGVSNRVTWTNQDAVAHTITSDAGYVDAINGKFDSLAHSDQTFGGFVQPNGGSWSFTFTKTGDYAYHCEPHPYMKGMVHIVENFS